MAFSTLGIIYTVNIEAFFALRFLQGLGACSGIVLSRAIINDLMDKKAAGKLYLVIFPFVGTSPAIAPFIGGILLQVFNWQATFIFLSLFIFLTILLCYFVLTETLPPLKRQSFTPLGILKSSLGVFRNKQFIFYALIPCFAYATYFAYIVESPFFLTALGLSTYYIGYSYIGVSLTYVLGNLGARRFLKRESMERAIRRGYVIFVMGGIVCPTNVCKSVAACNEFGCHLYSYFWQWFFVALRNSISDFITSPSCWGCIWYDGSFTIRECCGPSAAVIGKISGHNPWSVAILLAVCCIVGFVIYIRKANYFMSLERNQVK